MNNSLRGIWIDCNLINVVNFFDWIGANDCIYSCICNAIYLTWNTVCDCIEQFKWPKKETESWMIYMTLHRNTNTDDKEVLKNILNHINTFARLWWVEVYFPIHPRTLKKIQEFWLEDYIDNLRILAPVSYKEWLHMMKISDMIITDSGWIQEEACILWKRCIVIRDSTERPYVWSTLWNWSIIEAYAYLKDIKKIENVFNPVKKKSIGKYILSIIQKECQ